ncbi:MAG TPA: dethiobiotin synthase [Mariprofundaceae bacterium]|nr:dethiobiotin synthase [Mariprofundaceae bacterium]
MGRKIFITATDTGAGKTFVTANLIRLLLEQGISASAIKPVASGVSADGINEDVEALMQAQQLNNPDLVNLYTFRLPASPNIAAAAEVQQIEPEKLVRWCHAQAEKVDLCLIEGVGGLMVPLNETYLVSDWISDMQGCEVILVIGARLGCINHALLTLAQLKRQGITPAYIIINAIDESDISMQAETSLRPWLAPTSQLITLPNKARSSDFSSLLSRLLAEA